MNVNSKGVFPCAQVAAQVMVKQANCVIVSMASESGLEGSEGQSVYAASKNAVNSLNRLWAKELGKKKGCVVGAVPAFWRQQGYVHSATKRRLPTPAGSALMNFGQATQKLRIHRWDAAENCRRQQIPPALLLSGRVSYTRGVTINVAIEKARGKNGR